MIDKKPNSKLKKHAPFPFYNDFIYFKLTHENFEPYKGGAVHPFTSLLRVPDVNLPDFHRTQNIGLQYIA